MDPNFANILAQVWAPMFCCVDPDRVNPGRHFLQTFAMPSFSAADFDASIAKFRGRNRRQALRDSLPQVLATLPSAEASALHASGVAPQDFDGAFQDHEDILTAVGPCAATVWSLLRGVSSVAPPPPQELRDTAAAILSGSALPSGPRYPAALQAPPPIAAVVRPSLCCSSLRMST